MKILVATDQWFPDRKGGLARVATETARRLADRGHDVTVIAPRVNGSSSVERERSLTLRRVLPRTRLPKTLTDVVSTGREARAVRHERPDVVVAHNSTVAVGLRAAGLGAPVAYVYHASAPRELRDLRARRPDPFTRLKSYPLAVPLVAYERAALAHADRVLLLSEFSRSLLAADHPDIVARSRLVPGAVDVEAFSPGDGQEAARARLGLRPQAPLLVSVRRLEPRMGLDRLLHAVHRLRERQPVELALVGGGSLAGELRALADRLGLGGSVRFAGKVGDDELRDWYRAADLSVLPTVAYEGFGLATAEALASGTPVVGTPIGATPELLEPLDRRLVSAGAEPEPLAEAIERVLALTGPELRRRCREYAVARFSWDAAIAEWEAVLRETAATS